MKSNTRGLSVCDALRWGSNELEKAGVETPVFDAEVLLANSAILRNRRMARTWIFAHPEKMVSAAAFARYKKLIARRVKREPVAYIIGHKEFYGLDFLVNRNVLIPRPETEVLVERANYEIANLRNYESQNLTIVDVGTGSGAIAVAIAKELGIRNYELGIKFFATDISVAALRVARKNARRNGVGTLSVPKTPLSGVEKQITFLQGNLLEPIIRNFSNSQSRNLIITANLPYLPTPEWRGTMPEVRKWEPRGALEGGRDGLKYYREMFGQLCNLRNKLIGKQKAVQEIRKTKADFSIPISSTAFRFHNNYFPVTVLAEICPEQAKRFKKMVRGYFPKADFEIVKDLAGKKRVVIVRLKKN